MVEHVEEFGPELGAESFPELPVLVHGQIQVLEAGVSEEVIPAK